MRALPWAYASAAANAAFAVLTFGGPIFLLFLSEMGLDKSRIGAILTLFPLCGLLALGIAPWVAQVGVKRVYVAFYGIRTAVMAFLHSGTIPTTARPPLPVTGRSGTGRNWRTAPASAPRMSVRPRAGGRGGDDDAVAWPAGQGRM